MADTVNLAVTIDREDRRAAERLFAELGMTLDEAVAIFLKQCLLRKGLPFRVKLPNTEVPQRPRWDAEPAVREEPELDLDPEETTFADIDKLIQKLGIDV